MPAGGNRTSENRSAYDSSVDAVKVISAGTDSTGSALPANFDSLAQTLTPGTYGPTAVSATDGVNTWTQSLAYDGSGNLTGVSAWVRS